MAPSSVSRGHQVGELDVGLLRRDAADGGRAVAQGDEHPGVGVGARADAVAAAEVHPQVVAGIVGHGRRQEDRGEAGHDDGFAVLEERAALHVSQGQGFVADRVDGGHGVRGQAVHVVMHGEAGVGAEGDRDAADAADRGLERRGGEILLV